MIVNMDINNVKEKNEVRTIIKIKILNIKSLLEQVGLKALLELTNISFCLNVVRQTVPNFRTYNTKGSISKSLLSSS